MHTSHAFVLCLGYPIGHKDDDDDGYCYRGKNNNRDDQCKLIYGSDVTDSDKYCYEKYNVKGEVL